MPIDPRCLSGMSRVTVRSVCVLVYRTADFLTQFFAVLNTSQETTPNSQVQLRSAPLRCCPCPVTCKAADGGSKSQIRQMRTRGFRCDVERKCPVISSSRAAKSAGHIERKAAVCAVSFLFPAVCVRISSSAWRITALFGAYETGNCQWERRVLSRPP